MLVSINSSMDAEAVGNVAPDFKDRKHFNTLVIRPEYRISIRLGKIDDLFEDEPNTNKGKRARMQVLGLNYIAMDHPLGDDAFKNAGGQWDYYMKTILAGAADAAALADIQDKLEKWVVAGGELPPPADDPEKPEDANFVKIRFPGCHTFFKPLYGPPNPLSVQSPVPENIEYPWKIPYDCETAFIDANPALGKIPIVALVEKKDPQTSNWVPLPNAAVCFQLVKPYDLPKFDKTKGVLEQLNRPPVYTNIFGNGHGKLVKSEESYSLSSDDPQVNNAHKDRGGKRGTGHLNDGTDVANVIFSTTDVKGFNVAHAGRTMSHAKPYKTAKAVNSANHLHAVKAITNDDGESGVIFMPGRCGGDRFRIRVYLTNPKPNDDSLVYDGTSFTDVRVETGTFVLWRNIRISQYVRMPLNSVEAGIVADWAASYNLPDSDSHKKAANFSKGYCDLNVNGLGDNSSNYDGVVYSMAKSFCETDFDPGADSPNDMTHKQWTDAMAAFKDAVQQGQASLFLDFDIDALFYLEAGSTVNETNSLFCVPMRPPAAYNTKKAPGKTTMVLATHKDNLRAMVMEYGMGAFMKSIARNGYLPGITMINAADFCYYQAYGMIDGCGGLATEYRGFYVFYGQDVYPASSAMSTWFHKYAYDFTCTAMHELGHCRMRTHAPGLDMSGNETPGAEIQHHDKNKPEPCLMSYRKCMGQFCAKCLFTFRGWDRSKLPAT